jgi:DNA-directed RNA polymerase specialized sigma24 family protein
VRLEPGTTPLMLLASCTLARRVDHRRGDAAFPGRHAEGRGGKGRPHGQPEADADQDEPHVPEPIVSGQDGLDPEHEALLADSVGLALLVVLETLSPAERLAFVLHDMFAVPFEEIAPVVGRSPAAARQLASRARRRVQGSTARRPRAPAGTRPDPSRGLTVTALHEKGHKMHAQHTGPP